MTELWRAPAVLLATLTELELQGVGLEPGNW